MAHLPTRIGKYEIRRAIGRGAMGVVFEGYDPAIDRTVAIKTVRADELEPDASQEQSRRFLVEAKAAGRLSHRHIVALYDYGEADGLVYIVLEYVRGRELAALFAHERRLALPQVAAWMDQLLDALGYAHARGVVHRDVKPHNIFITDDGHVKLGDFGIARLDAGLRTHEGTLLGTPAYMAPEQIRGDEADARCDLYSAGVVLYQCLTGQPPFGGGMVPVIHKVLTQVPRPPSALVAGLPPALDAFVLRCLAKSPDDRPASAEAARRALADAWGAGADDDADQTVVLPLGTDFPARDVAHGPAWAAAPRAEAASADPLETPLARQDAADAPGAVVPGEPVLDPDPLRTAPADWALEGDAARPLAPSLAQTVSAALSRPARAAPRRAALGAAVAFAALAALGLGWRGSRPPAPADARAPDAASTAATALPALATSPPMATATSLEVAAPGAAGAAPALVASPPVTPPARAWTPVADAPPAATANVAMPAAPAPTIAALAPGPIPSPSPGSATVAGARASSAASAWAPDRAQPLSPEMAAAWQRAVAARARLDPTAAGARRPASQATVTRPGSDGTLAAADRAREARRRLEAEQAAASAAPADAVH